MNTPKLDIQKKPDWLAVLPTVSASIYSAILHEHPFMTRTEALQRVVANALQHARLSDLYRDDTATQHGRDYEDSAVRDLGFALGIGSGLDNIGKQQQQFLCEHDGILFSARPDGEVYVPAGHKKIPEGWYLVEVKCPFRREKKSIVNQLHYFYQVQMQLFCAQHQEKTKEYKGSIYYEWIFDSGDNDSFELIAYNEQKAIIKNMPHIRSFWEKILEILADKETALQWATAITRAVGVDDDIREYIDIEKQKKALTKKQSEIKKRIIEEHGEHNTCFYDKEDEGVRFILSDGTTTTMQKAEMLKDGVDMSRYEKISFTRRVRMPSPNKEGVYKSKDEVLKGDPLLPDPRAKKEDN